MKMAGVPVELSVATIFDAIMALLPIPETTTRPFDLRMDSTAPENVSSKNDERFRIASASVSIVFFAISRIAFPLLKVQLKLRFFGYLKIFLNIIRF
jgi:hypothetical protein